MSRTDAHVPEDVEIAQVTDRTIPYIRHHCQPNWPNSRFACDADSDNPERCIELLPDWASRQPWTRHRCATLERRSVVRGTLRKAVTAYRAGDDLDDLMMPDPATYCLCQMCGYGGSY